VERNARRLNETTPRWLRPRMAPEIVLGAALAALLTALLLPTDAVFAIMSEGAGVESATVVFYLIAAAAVALLRPPSINRGVAIMLTIVLLAFAARELDLHKSFTGMSMLRVSFYLDGGPLLPKVACLAVLLPVAASMLGLAARTHDVLRGVRRGEPAAWTALTFVVALILTKVADRSINILSDDFAVQAPRYVAAAVLSLEEVVEMCLPVLAALGWVQACFPGGATAAEERLADASD